MRSQPGLRSLWPPRSWPASSAPSPSLSSPRGEFPFGGRGRGGAASRTRRRLVGARSRRVGGRIRARVHRRPLVSWRTADVDPDARSVPLRLGATTCVLESVGAPVTLTSSVRASPSSPAVAWDRGPGALHAAGCRARVARHRPRSPCSVRASRTSSTRPRRRGGPGTPPCSTSGHDATTPRTSAPRARPASSTSVSSARSWRAPHAALELDGRAGRRHRRPPVRGRIEPTLLEGRRPNTAREIALGTETMRGLGVDLGRDVTVHSGAQRLRYRVVGRVIVLCASPIRRRSPTVRSSRAWACVARAAPTTI